MKTSAYIIILLFLLSCQPKMKNVYVPNEDRISYNVHDTLIYTSNLGQIDSFVVSGRSEQWYQTETLNRQILYWDINKINKSIYDTSYSNYAYEYSREGINTITLQWKNFYVQFDNTYKSSIDTIKNHIYSLLTD